MDTSAWGVKYNQSSQQYQAPEQGPPLPPRPTSAAPQPSPRLDQSNIGTQWQQGYGAQQQSQWVDSYYNQSQRPPTPPPRPAPYQSHEQPQYQQPSFPHQQYSHQPPSHRYDPTSQIAQQTDPQQPSHQYHSSIASVPPPHSTDYAPVSPIDDGNASHFYSSALGTGGPSDWEHFGGQSADMSPNSPPPLMGATATPGFDLPVHTNPQPSNVPQQVGPSATFGSPASMYAQIPPSQHNRPIPGMNHQDSASSSVLTDGLKRTGTIDSVIEAWNTPLKASRAPDSLMGSRPGSQGQGVATPVQERIVEVEKVVEKIVDPYDDLEPEVKASLKRYVVMLRKESMAETDEDKFTTFEKFVTKELRIRSLLYGVEPKLQIAKEAPKGDISNAPTEGPFLQEAPATSGLEHALRTSIQTDQPKIQSNSKQSAIPMAATAPVSNLPHSQQQPESTSHVQAKQIGIQAVDSSPHPSAAAALRRATPPMQVSTNDTSPNSKEGFVLVNARDDEPGYSPGGRPTGFNDTCDDEPEYSPGGRPLVKPLAHIDTAKAITTSPPKPQRPDISPGANAPMVLEDYIMSGPPSPGANAPMVVEPTSATELPRAATPNTAALNRAGNGQDAVSRPSSTTVKFEPSRPAYTPFKYNANVEAPRLPPDQSYSSLRRDGADSGRLMVHDQSLPPSSNASPVRSLTPSQRVHDEAFIGLIRQQSKAVRKKTPDPLSGPIAALRPGTPARTATPSVEPPPLPYSSDMLAVTAALRHLLPDAVPDSYGLSQHSKANSVKVAIDSFPDSFGFIHEIVVAWDLKNRVVRKKQDEERSARQQDSEQHIDGLFNDNEIGYADIGNLESEYKLDEAERKYREDQQELDSFTQGVYMPVTERLQKELAELNKQYTIAVDLLDLQSESASRMLKSSASKAEMAFVMNCVLSVSNKLEIRYQKIAEANVERERRRKRVESTVLYTNGDTTGVKSLEAEFAVAEKMQVLHEARGRDNRANKLMDTFDRATVRGLGDNQTYVDDLLVRIRELKELILKDPAEIPESVYEPEGPRDALLQSQKAIEFVLADSQKLLTISNVADKILNDADFAVSVAEAKVSNADSSTYEKLAEEKEKEDQKIVEDTNTRMASIANGPEEASVVIREVVDRVGSDPMHKDRIKVALEAAKRRNAGNQGGDGEVE